MEIREIKRRIMAILGRIESEEFEITFVNKYKAIQMLLLMSKVGDPLLSEMKESVNELLGEKEILMFENHEIAKLGKFLNHQNPTRDMLDVEPNKDELFIFAHVMKYPKELK